MTIKVPVFFAIGDKLLKTMILFLFILVVFTQVLLLYQPFSLQIALLEKLEGEKLQEELVYPAGDFNIKTNNLTFRLLTPYISSLPQANILINGKKVKDFTNIQTTINVKSGDKVTIDISKYFLNLKFKIIPSGNIKTAEDVLVIKGGQSVTISVENAN